MERAKLILLNGPPGIGKSTLARRYVDDHALALNLDIDAIRASLGKWQATEDSKLLARTLAIAMARAQLDCGHDVVVPQLVARIEFIEELERVALDTDARFVEVMLLDTPAEVVARFEARREQLTRANVRHPQEDIPVETAEPMLDKIYDSLLAVVDRRPATRVVDTSVGRVEDAYDAVLDVLSAER